jgi:hypothetical protein
LFLVAVESQVVEAAVGESVTVICECRRHQLVF